nr:MAG TPA: Protein of unknown function (DUF4087) [Caudoviricetes sp.]
MSANHNPLPGNIWVGDFFIPGALRWGATAKSASFEY